VTDPCDRAEDECEHELAEALRIRKPSGPAPTGWCYWCGDAVEIGMRWCDHSCEASWEYAENRMRQNGRIGE
jgi:hypothetical protein